MAYEAKFMMLQGFVENFHISMIDLLYLWICGFQVK